MLRYDEKAQLSRAAKAHKIPGEIDQAIMHSLTARYCGTAVSYTVNRTDSVLSLYRLTTVVSKKSRFVLLTMHLLDQFGA